MTPYHPNNPATPEKNPETVQARAVLPPWLALSENYVPPKDASPYIGKTLFQLLNRLDKLRQPLQKEKLPVSPVFKVLYILLLILCISLSTHLIFPLIVGTAILLYLAAQPGRDILTLLKKGFLAGGLTFVVTAPAIWLGHPQSCLILSGKTILTVLLVAILSHSTPWNRITAALTMLHVPALFIMTLDLTIQYITILGNLALQLLQALQLRSVGRNNAKYQSLSGVLGITFLKSREWSEGTYQARVCRGFSGSYHIPRTHTFHISLVLYIGIYVATILLFIWLERMLS